MGGGRERERERVKVKAIPFFFYLGGGWRRRKDRDYSLYVFQFYDIKPAVEKYSAFKFKPYPKTILYKLLTKAGLFHSILYKLLTKAGLFHSILYKLLTKAGLFHSVLYKLLTKSTLCYLRQRGQRSALPLATGEFPDRLADQLGITIEKVVIKRKNKTFL